MKKRRKCKVLDQKTSGEAGELSDVEVDLEGTRDVTYCSCDGVPGHEVHYGYSRSLVKWIAISPNLPSRHPTATRVKLVQQSLLPWD